MIRALGNNEYALWPLIHTCIGIVALIPISIGSGTARFLAHALGSGDLKKAEQITTSSFCALLISAAVYGLGVIFLSVYFERVFDIPAGAEGIGPWAMLLTGLSGTIAIPFSIFNGGLVAAQKFVILNILKIVVLISRFALIILAFSLNAPSLIWVGSIYLILEFANGTIVYIIAKKVVPWNRVRWRSFDWKVLWEVNNFSLLVLFIHIANLLYWRTDNFIINKLLEPSLLTGYSVIVSFVTNVSQFSSWGTSVLKPAAIILYAENNLPKLRRLLYRTNRIITPITASILVFLIIYGSELIEVYIGASYREYSALFPILAGVSVLSVTQNAAWIVPHAFGRLRIVSSILLMGAVANVALSIFFVLVLKWGLMGVAAGTAIIKVIEMIIFWPWYTSRLLRIRLLEYIYESYLVPLGGCIPALMVLLGMRWIGFGKNLVELVCVIMIIALVESIYLLACGIDKHDSATIMSYLRKFWVT